MAENVQAVMDNMVPALRDFEHKNIFNTAEIKVIIEKRREVRDDESDGSYHGMSGVACRDIEMQTRRQVGEGTSVLGQEAEQHTLTNPPHTHSSSISSDACPAASQTSSSTSPSR